MTVLTSSEPVPRFRTDLTLTGTGHGAGENVVTVTDPSTGAQASLRGFELSLARLLNGTRTAGEVVERAAAIGLPVTLESLSRFVARLRKHGFLVDGAAVGAASATTWPQRRVWPEDQRKKFQDALRGARTNHLEDAKQHLEALQGDAFEGTDVKELNEWVEQHLNKGDDEPKRQTFAELFTSVEQSWFEQGDLDSELAAKAPAGEPNHGELHHNIEPRRRRPLRAVGLVVLAAAIVLVAVIPWPMHARGTFELAPQATATVTVATAGVVGGIDVQQGQWVVPGDVILHYDSDPPKKKMAELEAQQASIQQKLDALAQAVAAQAQALANAQAELQKSQERLAEAQASNRRHDATSAQRHVKAAEKKVADADAVLAKARARAETAAGVTRDALTAQLAATASEHNAQKALADLPPLKATASGEVLGLAIKAGQTVTVGAPVCRLDDTRKLAIVIHAEDPRVLNAPQSTTATIDGKPIHLQIDKVEHGEARGVVDNPDRKIKPGTRRDISIDLERRSLLARWL
jgi:multidrug resistance efflux pump